MFFCNFVPDFGLLRRRFSPYYIYVNNVQQGPFDMNTLQTLASNGVLTPQTLVWKQGMANWEFAGNVAELSPLFGAPSAPPVPGL